MANKSTDDPQVERKEQGFWSELRHAPVIGQILSWLRTDDDQQQAVSAAEQAARIAGQAARGGLEAARAGEQASAPAERVLYLSTDGSHSHSSPQHGGSRGRVEPEHHYAPQHPMMREPTHQFQDRGHHDGRGGRFHGGNTVIIGGGYGGYGNGYGNGYGQQFGSLQQNYNRPDSVPSENANQLALPNGYQVEKRERPPTNQEIYDNSPRYVPLEEVKEGGLFKEGVNSKGQHVNFLYYKDAEGRTVTGSDGKPIPIAENILKTMPSLGAMAMKSETQGREKAFGDEVASGIRSGLESARDKNWRLAEMTDKSIDATAEAVGKAAADNRSLLQSNERERAMKGLDDHTHGMYAAIQGVPNKPYYTQTADGLAEASVSAAEGKMRLADAIRNSPEAMAMLHGANRPTYAVADHKEGDPHHGLNQNDKGGGHSKPTGRA